MGGSKEHTSAHWDTSFLPPLNSIKKLSEFLNFRKNPPISTISQPVLGFNMIMPSHTTQQFWSYIQCLDIKPVHWWIRILSLKHGVLFTTLTWRVSVNIIPASRRRGPLLTACNAAPPATPHLLWEPQKSKMAARGPQNGQPGLEKGVPEGFWALLWTFAK